MVNIHVEIVYATEAMQTLIPCTVTSPCTAQTAIQQSGILSICPDIDLTKNAIGVFGHKITLDTLVKEGDRIEIYRPLPLDPKQARKLRTQPVRRKR